MGTEYIQCISSGALGLFSEKRTPVAQGDIGHLIPDEEMVEAVGVLQASRKARGDLVVTAKVDLSICRVTSVAVLDKRLIVIHSS